MRKPTITFCTYTYNDGQMASELVRLSQSFTVRPDEIVVVDDGSEVPFSMKDAPDNMRILRLDWNAGITRAKGAGISAASSDLIFSMDCDTRVDPDWLERNLAYALTPQVGLVGGALAHGAGDDLVSRYMRAYGDNHNLHHIGPVDFIPGNAFLLRRKVWEEVGGFTDYHQSNCQDHYLSNRLKALGYTLFSNAEAKAWQRRRVIRTTMCKRVWKWCHKTVKQQMMSDINAVPYLFEVAVNPMLSRFDASIEKGEMLFLYIDLLYLAYTVLDLLEYGENKVLVERQHRDGFLTGLSALFSGHRGIHAVFKKDMALLGFDITDFSPHLSDQWNDFFMFSATLRDGGLMHWLNTIGLGQLMAEDSRGDYHFSSYAKADFSADMAV